MAIREYECLIDGRYFSVECKISDPLGATCPFCGASAIRVYTCAPSFGLKGNGIPNDSKDEKGYEQWQRDTWARLEDKLNVANAGTEPIDPKKLIGA